MSLSFDYAKKVASKYDVPVYWAYKFHDPSKDKYSIVKKWLEMEDSQDKDAFKKKMVLNPTLKNIIALFKKGNPDIPERKRNISMKMCMLIFQRV